MSFSSVQTRYLVPNSMAINSAYWVGLIGRKLSRIATSGVKSLSVWQDNVLIYGRRDVGEEVSKLIDDVWSLKGGLVMLSFVCMSLG